MSNNVNFAAGAPAFSPDTLGSIIPTTPLSLNIWFADYYGVWFGTGNGTTQPDATLTWDDANQWMQLAIPGAGGTGLAEMRWRGDFSRAGAADTFYLNQMLPGVLTITAGVTQTAAALFAFSNAQVSNAAQTVTDLYTVYVEAPTASGTVTRSAAIKSMGNVEIASGSALRWIQSATQFGSIELINTAGSYGLRNRLDSGGWFFTIYQGIVDYQAGELRLSSASSGSLGFGAGAGLTAGVSNLRWATNQATSNTLVWGLATTPKSLVFTDFANRNVDHGYAAQTDPTLATWSATTPATAPLAYSEFAYNKLSLGPGKGSRVTIQTWTEEVTIAAAATTAATVATIPAGAQILGATFRVTQAPGGGATSFAAARTTGTATEFTIAGAVALGTTTNSIVDGLTPGTIANATADTVTVTTDFAVTGASLKVRVAVQYVLLTPPTS